MTIETDGYETATLFESRPQVVEAVQWRGDNVEEVLSAVPDKTVHVAAVGIRLLAGVGGAQEWVPVPIGHWLVHPPGDLSDVWPVEDEYFRNKYTPKGLLS